MSRVVRSAFLALAAIAPACSSLADTLVLQDGRRIVGDVSQNDSGNYVVKTRAGQITFPPADVSKWEKGPASDPTVPKSPTPGGTAVSPEIKADPAAVTARGATLVEQGNAALLAGDAQAALENFQDAKILWDRQRIRMDYNNPAQFGCLHGLGIAYLALGRYEKANDPLDRAYPSSLKGRSLIINRAILDLVQKNNVTRGMKEVKDYLAKATGPDEIALNVLGAGLGLSGMDERFSQAAYYQSVVALYLDKSKELEASHSGDGLWGVEWVPASTIKQKRAAQDDGIKKYNAAVDAERKAEQLLKTAQARVDGLAASGQSPAQAYRDLDTANRNLVSRTLQHHEAWKAIPRPDWPKTFAPLLPESVGGGVFGKPAPKQVATIDPPAPPTFPSQDPKPKPVSTQMPVAPETRVTVTPPPAVKPAKRSVTRSAVAVPVSIDLLVTASAPIDNATEIQLETTQGDSFKAEIVRKDAASGLALLRVPGKRFAYLNLAPTFAGGEVVCWGFPNVAIFNPVSESFAGTAVAGKGSGWSVAMGRHPRLPGTAILDKTGKLVGIGLGERDTAASKIPAATLEQLRAFLGTDLPRSLCSNPDPSGVMQLTATRESP